MKYKLANLRWFNLGAAMWGMWRVFHTKEVTCSTLHLQVRDKERRKLRKMWDQCWESSSLAVYCSYWTLCVCKYCKCQIPN